MIIERKNGWIHISDIIKDYFETRKYMGYTESQAKKLFKEEFSTKRNYMCDNCGGGFNKEEIIFKEDNSLCVCCNELFND